MARTLQYIFPPSNGQDVCALQTTAGAGNLILNGNLAKNSQVSFLSHGYSRSVSLTSGNDLSGVSFTIIGIQNGVQITEIIIDGPDQHFVFSTNIFDVVTSIFANAPANGISVGSGYSGFFPLIEVDLERDVINYTLTIAKLTDNSIATQVLGGISNIINNGSTYLDNIDNNNAIFEIKALDVNDNYKYSDKVIFSYLLIAILGDEEDLMESIEMNFIQN